MYDKEDPVARYYDFSFGISTEDEINYFKEIANETQGPIVDLCCGTGLLAKELETKIKKVYAIDRSESMLNKLKIEVKDKNIEIIQSEMNCFSIPEKVYRIICRDAFFHNLNHIDQRKTLSRVNNALEINGIFAFNIHVPNPSFLCFAGSDDAKKFNERNQYIIPNTNNLLKISQSLNIDYDNQIIYTSLKFEIFDNNKRKLSEEYSSWESRYTFPYEMFYLLELEGFRIRNAYGNYNKSKWNNKSMLIIEAEKIS